MALPLDHVDDYLGVLDVLGVADDAVLASRLDRDVLLLELTVVEGLDRVLAAGGEVASGTVLEVELALVGEPVGSRAGLDVGVELLRVDVGI